jgi:glutamate 5-kinase
MKTILLLLIKYAFGDNDTLAALVANLIDADLLVILTDQEGLFDADPQKKSRC